jgi:hypothetical protein
LYQGLASAKPKPEPIFRKQNTRRSRAKPALIKRHPEQQISAVILSEFAAANESKDLRLPLLLPFVPIPHSLFPIPCLNQSAANPRPERKARLT